MTPAEARAHERAVRRGSATLLRATGRPDDAAEAARLEALEAQDIARDRAEAEEARAELERRALVERARVEAATRAAAERAQADRAQAERARPAKGAKARPAPRPAPTTDAERLTRIAENVAAIRANEATTLATTLELVALAVPRTPKRLRPAVAAALARRFTTADALARAIEARTAEARASLTRPQRDDGDDDDDAGPSVEAVQREARRLLAASVALELEATAGA